MDPHAGQPVRPASLDAVLSFAWDAGPFTATEAMTVTNLTRSTTIAAVDTLVQWGLLRELPNARAVGEYVKGRPARRFEIRPEAAVVVGVDAGHEHVTATVADLGGASLATRRARLEIDKDSAAERRALIGDLVDEAVAAAGLVRADVLAVCVGVPAPVNAQGVSPAHRNHFWERMNPRLVDLFLQWAPIVRVENDASLAAYAEGAVGGAQGCRNYVALLAGARLGAGVVVDGHLLRGAHGGVGEMVAFDHVSGVGSADGLGTRAARWARQKVADQQVAPGGPLASLRPEEIDGQHVLELAAAGDPDALAVVKGVGQVLGRVSSVLTSMFDPQVIVVSGAMSARAEQLVRTAQDSLATGLDLPPPQIRASTLGADVVVTGAVAAAVTEARTGILDLWQHRSERDLTGEAHGPARPATATR